MSAENVELPRREHRWLNLGMAVEEDFTTFRCRDCRATVRVHGLPFGPGWLVEGDELIAFSPCLPPVEAKGGT